MVRRVCLVSGGTGGHLMPALVLARGLRERGHEPVLLTEGRDVERAMVERELPDVPALRLPGKDGAARPSRLQLPLWLMRTTLAMRKTLRDERIDCVVSTGGRPSVPAGLAARSLSVPLFLLEQNAVTGRANRLLAPFAKRVYRGLPERGHHDPGFVTGTPLRPGVGSVERAAARRELGLPEAGRVVLVTGGSQGARALNEAVPAALQRLADGVTTHVLHLAGAGNADDVAARYGVVATESDAEPTARTVKCQAEPATAGPAFLPTVAATVWSTTTRMAECYAAADLVICRGGGTTVAELIAAGRPAVIVPYPFHRDRQQVRNAEVLVEAGAAELVEQRDLTVTGLADRLARLLGDPGRLAAMANAAGGVTTGSAATTILDDLERANGWSEEGA